MSKVVESTRLDQIPEELKKLNQWVGVELFWIDAKNKYTKIPKNPHNGQRASTTDPTTWGSFEEASHYGPFVGFVFTADDEYAVIDLDPPRNRHPDYISAQKELIETTKENTYTETSLSGEGHHIIVKGIYPEDRKNRDDSRGLEFYDRKRFVVMTGEAIGQSQIDGGQELLNQFSEKMGYKNPSVEDSPEFEDHTTLWDDARIVDQLLSAGRNSKADRLFNGRWQGEYTSQSEADMALLSLICLKTTSDSQVRRIFRCSPLGKREKAQRNNKYLDHSISQLRASEPPPVDIDLYQTPKPPNPDPVAPLTYPPGLLGQMAQYIEASAVRPVPEAALAGALTFAAGTTGRYYNISGTGLNQYIILIGGTGVGKEGAKQGIDRIMQALRPHIPVLTEQFLGPATIASGQALIKRMEERPCQLSVVGEFGIKLNQMCGANAHAGDESLMQLLLDLYTKSGWYSSLESMIYSNSEKNTDRIQAPAFTLLGESTPESLFTNMTENHIGTGLLPRFSFIEYLGNRPKRNPQAFYMPPQELVDAIAERVTKSLELANAKEYIQVGMNTAAGKLLDDFDQKADDAINQGDGVQVELWNRAHLKALKLAALVAVWQDPHQPQITESIALWAIGFVERETQVIMGRFEDGSIGGSRQDIVQEEIMKVMHDYINTPFRKRINYKVKESIAKTNFIPYNYIRRRMRNRKSVQDKNKDASKILNDALEDLGNQDRVRCLPPAERQEKFGYTQTEVYELRNG